MVTAKRHGVTHWRIRRLDWHQAGPPPHLLTSREHVARAATAMRTFKAHVRWDNRSCMATLPFVLCSLLSVCGADADAQWCAVRQRR